MPGLSVSNAVANQVDVCKIFVKVVSGICQSCNTDLLMLLHAFVKVGIWACQVLTYISCPNQTMLKFDQDFKGRCRICLCCSAERTMSVENVQFLTDGINLDTQGRVQKFSLFLQIMERFCGYETEV